MKAIKISKSYFDVDSNFSNGLICGLKNLQNMGFEILTKEMPNNFFTRVLEKEKILLGFDFSSSEIICEVTGEEIVFSRNQKAIKLDNNGNDFSDIVSIIKSELRSSERKRETRETSINIRVSLDGEGRSNISTGIGFFDHMLDQIARHSNIDLDIDVKGDLWVDEHHTVEDTGIVLGESILDALGSKSGIQRYGFVLPMDESVAECAIDLGGRSRLNFQAVFAREKVGEFPTELVEEFFQGISAGMKANIYLRSEGKNDHHKIESLFKAFAKALNEACRLDERNNGKIPSTKGTI